MPMGVRDHACLSEETFFLGMCDKYPLTGLSACADESALASVSDVYCNSVDVPNLHEPSVRGKHITAGKSKMKYVLCDAQSPVQSGDTSWTSQERLQLVSDGMSSSLPNLCTELDLLNNNNHKLGRSLADIFNSSDTNAKSVVDCSSTSAKNMLNAEQMSVNCDAIPSSTLNADAKTSCLSTLHNMVPALCSLHTKELSDTCLCSTEDLNSTVTHDHNIDPLSLRTNTTFDLTLTLQSDETSRKADASSLSSISSLGTGSGYDDIADVGIPTDFVDVNLLGIPAGPVVSGNTFERSKTLGSEDSGFDERQLHQFDTSAKPVERRRGIASFLTRGLFSRKSKQGSDDHNDEMSSNSSAGWRLFGKVPPRESSTTYRPAADSHTCHLVAAPVSTATRRRDVEAASTTALILEHRPRGLPSKDPEEALRHRLEYEAMVDAAKRKEVREAKERKKQLEQQLRHEDALSAAVKIWNTDILPNWDTVRTSKRVREMWWQGIPPSVRGRVWRLAIGNELNLTPELYEICLVRAKDRLKLLKENGGDTDSISSVESAISKESSMELIKLDVSRTFPQLCIFQKCGPYHEPLQALLAAYVSYRPDVGYVQGMSFIAAVLLLNMNVADAFICFANLLNRPCTITFFRLDESLMMSYFYAYEEFFEANLPNLYAHFSQQQLTPDLYVIDWMFTLYARSLPLDVASRVWDVFCRDGEEFLFRTALGILKLYEDILLAMDFIHLAQFLTRLPDRICADALFTAIDSIHMSTDKKRFQQVLHECRERDT